ncbi:MAG TPA: GNAT family N-acetyltransferase [Pyrinomonadaceae bacterium]|jgi:RimJ/RimL family protein N-acetyltransferase|nr:GNAT family N-acetyltransferase [Pyrinomonadaceae bacterium]
MKYFMQTARLGFRRWLENDLDIALGLWGDPDVTRLIDARGKLSEEQVRERLDREIATDKEYGVQYWPIFRLEGDEHVGCCGLRPYDMSGRVYALGFHIRSSHWRRGYAHEAARAVIDYAFNTLGARRLFAGHNPANESSRRLLKKLGFQYTHDEYFAPTGQNHPSYLLKAEDHSRPGLSAGEGGELPQGEKNRMIEPDRDETNTGPDDSKWEDEGGLGDVESAGETTAAAAIKGPTDTRPVGADTLAKVDDTQDTAAAASDND